MVKHPVAVRREGCQVTMGVVLRQGGDPFSFRGPGVHMLVSTGGTGHEDFSVWRNSHAGDLVVLRSEGGFGRAVSRLPHFDLALLRRDILAETEDRGVTIFLSGFVALIRQFSEVVYLTCPCDDLPGADNGKSAPR